MKLMVQISKYQPMFSPIIQQTVNCVWLTQILICIVYCCIYSKWIPPYLSGQKETMSIFEKQFQLVLWAHILFYIAELGYTQIWERDRNLAYHHLASLFLLPLSSLHLQSVISVIFLIPFAIHSWYWSLEDTPYILVWLYNLSLGASCFFALRRHFKTRPKSIRFIIKSPVMIPLAGIAVGLTNASTFITRWFNGTF
jgi:hypothetical protein